MVRDSERRPSNRKAEAGLLGKGVTSYRSRKYRSQSHAIRNMFMFPFPGCRVSTHFVTYLLDIALDALRTPKAMNFREFCFYEVGCIE
jgi:hypothetical protein